MAVHAVMLESSHHVRLLYLILHLFTRLAFGHHVAAEFTRNHNEVRDRRPRSSRSRISCRNRAVDRLLHSPRALVAIFMRVPMAERNVFGSDFDETDAFFDQPCERAGSPVRSGPCCRRRTNLSVPA